MRPPAGPGAQEEDGESEGGGNTLRILIALAIVVFLVTFGIGLYLRL